MYVDVHAMRCTCRRCPRRAHLTRAQRIDLFTTRFAIGAGAFALAAIPARWLLALLPF